MTIKIFKSNGLVSVNIKSESFAVICDTVNGKHCIHNLLAGDSLVNPIVDYVNNENELNIKKFCHFVSYDEDLSLEVKTIALNVTSFPHIHEIYSKRVEKSSYLTICLCDFFYDAVMEWLKTLYEMLWKMKTENEQVPKSYRQLYIQLDEEEESTPEYQYNKDTQIDKPIYVDVNEYWTENE